MNKRTIFAYEMKRLLFSRTYLLLLVVTLAVSLAQLKGTVLFGFRYTAPYSLWTFCAYVSTVAPILFVMLMMMGGRAFTPWERGAQHLVRATPMPEAVYRLIRYGASACAFLIAAALSVCICLTYYWTVFDFRALGGMIALSALLFIPTAIFLFGLSMLAGRWKSAFVYVLLAVVLIGGLFQIPLPAILDMAGSSILNGYDPSRPAFAIPAAYWAGRTVLFLTGAACMAFTLHLSSRKSA